MKRHRDRQSRRAVARTRYRHVHRRPRAPGERHRMQARESCLFSTRRTRTPLRSIGRSRCRCRMQDGPARERSPAQGISSRRAGSYRRTPACSISFVPALVEQGSAQRPIHRDRVAKLGQIRQRLPCPPGALGNKTHGGLSMTRDDDLFTTFGQIQQLAEPLPGIACVDLHDSLPSLLSTQERMHCSQPGQRIRIRVCEGSVPWRKGTGSARPENPSTSSAASRFSSCSPNKTTFGPEEFVWVGGDVHLYPNPLDKAREQLVREPCPFPDPHLISPSGRSGARRARCSALAPPPPSARRAYRSR